MAESNRIESLKWFSATRALTREEVWWLIEQAEKLDKLQYEASRTEDIVLTYARKKDLKGFCEKWNTKLYSDSDHNIPNMILDFLHAIEE